MEQGFTIWFTGLSGAGKTTISKIVAEKLEERGISPEILDGDVVRTNLSKGLGFSREDRETNLKRIAFVCKLLSKHGACVIACTISPYRKIRRYIRDEIRSYVQVHISCPLEICERRDPKGLYRKARSGEIRHFTGISDPYELPENSEIEVRTDRCAPEEGAEQIISWLEENGYIKKLIGLPVRLSSSGASSGAARAGEGNPAALLPEEVLPSSEMKKPLGDASRGVLPDTSAGIPNSAGINKDAGLQEEKEKPGIHEALRRPIG